MGGRQYTVRNTGEFDLVCKCGLTPDAIAEIKLKKYNELIDWIYSIVSVNCTDAGEAHAEIQKEIEKIKELNKENIEIQQEGVAWYKEAWNSVKTMNNALATYNENEKSASAY